MTLAEKGRLFLSEHPNAQPIDLVENCGFKIAYAKTFIPSEKRRKSIIERIEMYEAAQPDRKHRNLEQEHRDAIKHIDWLDKQIVGYKAVINYLEHQLVAAHGSSV